MTRTDVEARLIERLTRLADYAPTTPGAAPSTVTLVASTAVRRPHKPVWAVAAGVAIIVAATAVVVATVRDPDHRSSAPHATITGEGPDQGGSFDRGAAPPEIALPGWATAQTQTGSSHGVPGGSRLFLVVEDPERGFDGARIKVGVTAPPGGFSAGPTAQPVDVNGTTASLGTAPDRVYLAWSPAPGRTVYVDGTRATQDQVLAVARGLQIAPDLTNATATVVPPGLRATPLDPPQAVTTNWGEYKFTRGDAMLQVDLYAGGRTTFEDRLGDPSRNVSVRGTTGALRDEGVNRYWVDILDGRWAVEVAGGPFTSEAEFLAAVNALEVTG